MSLIKVIRFCSANPLPAVFIAAVVGIAAGSIVALPFLASAAMSLSLMAAMAAVILPQMVLFYMPLSRRAFNIWLCRFSLIVLFLAVAGRGLAETGLLSGGAFVTGVVAGVVFNIILTAWFFRRSAIGGA